MCKFHLDFRKTSCFISKNKISKVVLKYQVSMLTCPSVHLAYPKIHFRITRTVNPLSQLYIYWKFQKYISVSTAFVTERLLWYLSLLHLKTMNGAISRYELPLQRLLHFTACLSVLSIFSFFLLFCGLYYLLMYGGKFNNTYNNAIKLFLGS